MKRHLKSIAAPKTWFINRKKNVFVIRPNPGAHSLDLGLPLGVIIRDQLKLVLTTSEVKKMLRINEVLVDGRRRMDIHFIVGLFDTISIPSLGQYYRVQLDRKGRLVLVEITAAESKTKLCKVVGKTVLPKGKIQLNLHDGKNIITEIKAGIGDTLLMELPKLKVQKVLYLKPGAAVFLTQGKHIGNPGVLTEIKGREAKYAVDEQEIETIRDYLFVVGEKEMRTSEHKHH